MPVTPRRTPFVGLWLGGAISQAGNAMTMLAVPWFVLYSTGSPLRTAIAAAAVVVAHVLGGFCGGWLADRYDRRDLCLVADSASGVTIALIPLCASVGQLSFPVLIALVFASALLDAPGQAARFALIPHTARLGGIALERANGVVHGAAASAQIAGWMVAGLLLSLTSPHTVMWIDAATFAVSVVLTASCVPRGLRGDTSGSRAGDVFAGLRHIWRDRLLRTFSAANLATNFLGAPLFTVIMVSYVQDRYGAALAMGPIVAAGGIGLAAGGFAFSRWGARIPRRAGFIVGFASFGAQYWLLALHPPLAIILVIFAVRGVLTGFYNPIIDTVTQQRVSFRVLGSVAGAASAIAIIGEPAGLGATGFLVENTSVTIAMLTSAMDYTVVTIVLARSRALRAMDTAREDPIPEPSNPAAADS